ncbi:EutN/CcmL family microcompartment protein [Anaerovorax sp. IOR16]|uniref:EutN/CcmL family microcompartment protein n=1 Tax=Anaerovorax sp. IOR16 TaxID=2773458 RepID=UPI0019D06F6A|nr:EutN/CcmL family microcompartment protein [Anaerovorax sp. IOR16]
MYLAKVVGTVVSTRKDDNLVGNKMLLIKKLSDEMEVVGRTEIAVDTVGAGTGEIVIISMGSSAKYALGNPKSPVDATIVGIVDSVELNI